MTSPRMESPAARDWEFPRSAAGLGVLISYAARKGIGGRAVLAGTGLADQPAGPRAEITAAQELRAVRNLRRLLGDDAAAELGRAYDLGSFGAFGFAVLSSRTVHEAMNVALRFIDLSYTFAIPSAEVVGSDVLVTLDGTRLPPDVRRFLVERDATAVHGVLDELVPGGVGGRLSLHDDRALLTFDVSELDRPLPRGNPDSVALYEQLCAEVVTTRRRRSGVTQDARVLIAQKLATGAPMPEVAADLGLSERSLRRRLEAESVSYQALLDEVRESLARELLRGRATLAVEDLAVRLGYAGATSFIHAFRRWTGTTPAAFSRAAVRRRTPSVHRASTSAP
jgi:AraC-like DNA-binding protein